jgi:hypothetical protein
MKFLSHLRSLAFLFMTLAYSAAAQQGVVIGSNTANPTPSPDANAVLWLIGNGNQGLIVPIVTNTTAVVTPAKGMVVYNAADNTLYYYNGNWTAVGTGSTGGGSALLKISGNTVSVDPAGTASISLASTAPSANGQLMMWDGTKWTSSTGAAPTNGQYLQWNTAANSWQPVNSPATSSLTNPMTIPNEMIIGGTSGTPVKLNAPGSANKVLTTDGAGAPTWNNTLSLGGSLTVTGSVTTSSSVSAGSFIGNGNQVTNLDAGKITAGVVPIANGGTGGGTTSAGLVFAGPTIGIGAPSFRALTAADIPSLNLSKVASGTLPVAQGGTGLSATPLAGQLLIGNGTGFTLSTLSVVGGLAISNTAGSIILGTSGNFGVQNLTTTGTLNAGATTVNGDLTISGYTQMGASAPGIQVLEITGTTANSADGVVNINTGIDQSRIVFSSVYVLDVSSELIPPMYMRTGFPTYVFNYFFSGSTLFVINVDAAPFSSLSIRNRPVRATIFYKP